MEKNNTPVIHSAASIVSGTQMDLLRSLIEVKVYETLFFAQGIDNITKESKRAAVSVIDEWIIKAGIIIEI